MERLFVGPKRLFWPAVLILPGILFLGYVAVAAVRAGTFYPSLCFVLSAGVALLFVGCLINSEWRSFASWASLGLIGQAAALQMIDAGRHIHFQHYRPIAELVSEKPLILLIVAAQTTAVLIAIINRRRQLVTALKKIGTWRVLMLLIMLSVSSAAVTPDLTRYFASLTFGTVVQLISLGCVFLAVSALPSASLNTLREKFAWFLCDSDRGSSASVRSLDPFVLGLALGVTVLCGLLSYFVYQAHPHVPDETQYLFQAKYFAAGHLTVSPPLVPEAFSMYMVPYLDDRWYSIFSPGFSAILAVGLKLGAVWIVNPILAGLCVLLGYLLIRELYSASVARPAVLLLSVSPWFVFMGMNLMSHMFTLTCSLGAALCLIRAFRRNNAWLAIAAGLIVGVVSLIRPLDGFLVGSLLGFWTIFSTKTWTAFFKFSAALFLGAIVSAALVLPYNQAVTGSWFALPLETYYAKYFWPGASSIGFGAQRGFGWGLDAFPGHTPLEALVNTALNIFQLNTELLGWGTGSLLFIGYLLVSGGVNRKDIWAWITILFVIVAFSTFWYHGGPDFGPRYWFICIVPLVVLTIRGMMKLTEQFSESQSDAAIDPRIAAAAMMLCLISGVSYLSWRASDKYYRYLEMQPGIADLAKQVKFGDALVLVRGDEHPDYQSAWIFNEPNFDGSGPLYARDKSPEIRQQLLHAYPNRQVFLVDGPTVTGGEYVVRVGPVSTQSLLEKEGETLR